MGRAEPCGPSRRYGWVIGTGPGRTFMPDDPNGFARDLFDGLPARYDRLAELLSFGQNGQWRAGMGGHFVPAGGGVPHAASRPPRRGPQTAPRNPPRPRRGPGGGGGPDQALVPPGARP